MSPKGVQDSLSDRADAIEHEKIMALAKVPMKSVIYTSGGQDPTGPDPTPQLKPGQHFLLGPDPRLTLLPDKPTLFDFFRHRFFAANHVLQSARMAQAAGHPEKVVLACLLHDISIMGFIRCDHGYWGAEMIAPYVDEEVAWAIRAHQVLRFFPDPAAGYEYPEMYVKLFGEGYRPEPYVVAAYEKMKNHPWYMTARLITVNDVYAWDPDTKVTLEDFEDIVGRHFRQPKEGLGFDDSPAAHIWRTINWPTRFL
jgi:hypothetical protein